jgi:hypothetical protein
MQHIAAIEIQLRISNPGAFFELPFQLGEVNLLYRPAYQFATCLVAKSANNVVLIDIKVLAYTFYCYRQVFTHMLLLAAIGSYQ